MKRDPIRDEDVIAERRLKLKRPDGSAADVTVRFGRPAGRPVIVWEVPYEILGPNEEVRRHVGSGADAVQALTIALMECPMHLDFIKEQGELTNEDGPDLWWPRVMLETVKGG
ncbi:hypothetical protein WMF38_23120 [Sorangium sp. So ce118]